MKQHGRTLFKTEKEYSNDMKIHRFWHELMEYVKENGGYLRLSVRFKDGLPVEADEIKKKVRFDINSKND